MNTFGRKHWEAMRYLHFGKQAKSAGNVTIYLVSS